MSNRIPMVIAAALALAASPVAGQPSFGPQLSYGTRSDLGAGVRGFIPVPPLAPAVGSIAVDYFFGDERPGRDVTWVELVGGLTWPLGLETAWDGDAYVGVGPGLSLVTESPEDGAAGGDTDLFPGLDLVAGWKAETLNFASFVEVRAVLGAAGQVVFTGGLAFGGGR